MIYCVEDERNIRELLVYTLETTGFEAEGFETGAELDTAMKKNLPELILLDIMLPGETPVSMNMWGFTGGFMKELVKRFPVFLEKSIPENPLKCEYFLPFVVDELLQEKKAAVRVLTTQDKWYGVTYKEDKPVVVAAIQNLKDQGLYPQGLWD